MRTVSFGLPEGARDPLCDERDVMKKFNSHVKHCDTCYDNLSSWQRGKPLCSRGHGYVLDMQPYFFCRSGKPYSMIDRNKRDENTRVLIPSDFRHVTVLFESLEHGYNTGSSRSTPKPKVIIHQPVQEIRPRREHRPVDHIIIPAEHHHRSQTQSPRSPRAHYREERYHREPRRGSLYHEDQRRRYHAEPQIIIASPDRYYR